MYAVFKVHSMFTQLNSLTFVKVRELPRTKFKLRLRLAFIKLLSANGDGEIRTLDPLLARQVLSQLSYTPIESGTHLLSHTVSSAVPSAAWVLTIVFGMGTGVSPNRIATGNIGLP